MTILKSIWERIKWSRRTLRWQHKWLGIVLCLLLLCFCLSGIVLNHRRTFADANIPRNWLPEEFQFHHWNNGLLRGTLPYEDGSVLIYGKGGIFRTDMSGKHVADFNEGLPTGADFRSIARVERSKDGALYAAAQYGLYRYDESQWQEITFDHPDDELRIMDGLEDYAGRAWYEKRLHIPITMKGQQLRLQFEAVYHDATIYINGRQAGSHVGKGYTPFSVDITPYVIYGQENKLVVEVDNSFSTNNFPYKRAFDWANDGGIYRPVNLYVSGSRSIRYAHFTPSLNLADSTGTSHVSIRLYEPKVKRAAFELKMNHKHTGQVVFDKLLTLKQTAQGTFEADIDCGKVEPWHFDHPALYSFEVCVFEKGTKISDIKTGHIGFRDFRIEGNRFVLNGEPVRLPGIESMPGSNPEYGMAEPADYIRHSATMLKDLNATITRFHWPQGEDMLGCLDSLGILTQEELSWWQQPGGELTPDQEALARETLAELIEAHHNHPCIFAWAVSNEVGGNHATVKRLGDFIKSQDPQHMTETVGNRIYRNMENDPSLLLDIPTWNEYIGTWHGSGKKIREELPGYFEKISPVLNGRPLFITEYGLCEPAFVGGDRRRIDDMLYHIKEWQRQDFVTGYIYFCLEDYRTQMGEEGTGRHRIRRHGVTDYRHQPKPSYYVLRDLMCPVEIDKVQPSTAVRDEQSLAGVWQANANDRTLIVGISVKNSIPSYTLRGYTLRYVDSNDRMQTIAQPTMLPGQRYDITVPNINARFKFDICRPDGGTCLNY